MRHLLTFVLMLALTGSATAADLGNSSNVVKGDNHVLMNQSWDREGGEDVASAVVFTAIPFYDTGATCDNVDDYDVCCPYCFSDSPDVVYSFTPSMDMIITVDLDGSGYDTKVYVLDDNLNMIACNDDSHLPGYVSYIEEAALMGGTEYFIVVDGYGGDCGDYVLNITEFFPPEPCVLPSYYGYTEGEPTLVDGYEDRFNGGCNSVNTSFSDVWSYNVAGVGGWYISADGSQFRDTDWYIVMFDEGGIIEWTVDAESETACYLLDIPDCDNVSVTQSMTAGPCLPGTMIFEGVPGNIAFLFVGSSSFSQDAAGHPTNEYVYIMNFIGNVGECSIAVEAATWGSVKSLYR